MVESRFSFRKGEIDKLPVPAEGQRAIYYDTRVPHLALRVTDRGTKTFIVYRWVDGKALKRTIGRYPDFTIEQARVEAQQLNSQLAQGQDPMIKKREEKEELTLGQLFEEYIERYAQDRCSTWTETKANFYRYFGEWTDRKLSKISRMDVQLKINQLGKDGHPHRANRAHDDLRAVFEWGIKKNLCTVANPCIGIDRFKTQSRERFIRPDELVRFFKALMEAHNTDIRDYIVMSLLTGARQYNVLTMRWDEIDFALGTWRIPKTKNGESQTVPLTRFALQLLNERHTNKEGDWVFPGKFPGTHLKEPKATWRNIVSNAGLTDLRMHDLRRTLGSYMAMGNQSLQIIGKALGHKSHTSTQIYARLANDPVRQAMEKAQADMLQTAGVLQPISDAQEILAIEATPVPPETVEQ